MDLDSDGKTDILSGSYSRSGNQMAGLFYVLRGDGKRGFQKAQVVRGKDGEELLVGGKDDIDRICTRPTAVDLDGDGVLDIVAGNFRGTFAFFRGTKDGDKSSFEPQATWLKDKSGAKLAVDYHSDPVLVDWDGDGDLDMLSGSASGSVYYFPNVGSAKKPAWGARETFVQGGGHGISMGSDIECGDAHLEGAQSSVRVCVEDMNGDGKLDLLVGDQVTLYAPAEGHTEASMRKALEEWSERYQALMKEWSAASKPDGSMDFATRQKLNKRRSAMMNERKKIVHEDRTGFVWLYTAK